MMNSYLKCGVKLRSSETHSTISISQMMKPASHYANDDKSRIMFTVCPSEGSKVTNTKPQVWNQWETFHKRSGLMFRGRSQWHHHN